MSNSLEPGDLAEIIKSLDGLSVGKIVQCVRIDYVNHPEHGTIWLVQSKSDDLVTEYGGIGNNVHVPADWLKKIQPPKISERKMDTEKLSM